MMKNPTLQKWLPCLAAGLALAGSTTLSSGAAPLILQDFNANINGWSINFPATGCSASWNATAGVDGTGCLQVTITNGGTQVGPLGTMPNSYSTADYWKYEFDMMIDPASGVDGGGGYGNLQTVMRSASWSWDSYWFGAIDTAYNTWQHKTVILAALPVLNETMWGFQLSASSGSYNADVIIYLDNLKITPMENPWVMHPFTNDTEIATGFSSTVGGGAAFAEPPSIDTSKDAGGGFTPLGALKVPINYDTTVTGWQEGRVQFDMSFDTKRYSSIEFDVYVDTTSAAGGINAFIVADDWSWNGMGWTTVDSSLVGKWTHVSLGLGSFTKTGGRSIILQCGGTSTPTTYWFDNIKLVKTYTPPTITKLANGTPAGLQILMDNDSSQWQREGISTPSDAYPVFWYPDIANGPVSYSFTINDFPDPKTHGGFSAHLFFANIDTDPSAPDGNNGAVDWNAADLIDLHVTANANGGFDYSLNWKTNKAAANTDHQVASVHSDTAIGTWALTFTSPTNATMTGPGGISTNVTLPEEAVINNFNPNAGLLHFGMFKNDGANDGHNNGVSGTFARVQKTGGNYTFDENFNGTNITANYSWRVSRASSVALVPAGVGKWMTWTLPDDGYAPQVAGDILGPWKDVTNIVRISTSTKRIEAISAADIPAGPSAFFRLKFNQ